MTIEYLIPWIVLIATIASLAMLGVHDYRAGYRTSSRSISPIGDFIGWLAGMRQSLSRTKELSRFGKASPRIPAGRRQAVFTWVLTASTDSNAKFRMVETKRRIARM